MKGSQINHSPQAASVLLLEANGRRRELPFAITKTWDESSMTVISASPVASGCFPRYWTRPFSAPYRPSVTLLDVVPGIVPLCVDDLKCLQNTLSGEACGDGKTGFELKEFSGRFVTDASRKQGWNLTILSRRVKHVLATLRAATGPNERRSRSPLELEFLKKSAAGVKAAMQLACRQPTPQEFDFDSAISDQIRAVFVHVKCSLTWF
jgi:hypothetical protein